MVPAAAVVVLVVPEAAPAVVEEVLAAPEAAQVAPEAAQVAAHQACTQQCIPMLSHTAHQ